MPNEHGNSGNSSYSSDDFAGIIESNYPEMPTHSPYGGPEKQQKPGITRRGKLVIGGAAVAAVTVLGIGGAVAVNSWQENRIREQELALELRLAEMRHEEQLADARAALADADPAQVCIETEDGERYEAVASCSPSDISQTAAATGDAEDAEGGGTVAAPASVVVLVLIGGGLYLAARKKTA